jgi:hypothetical protein
MPDDLRAAHNALNKTVDSAYGKRSFANEAERVAYLFSRYQELTSLLPVAKAKRAIK